MRDVGLIIDGEWLGLVLPGGMGLEEDFAVIHRLPPSPQPWYTPIDISCSSEVPAQIAADLQEIGIPAGLIGYEYRPPPPMG